MKRGIITLLSLCAVSLCAFAQGGRIPLLEKAHGQRVQFQYAYSLSKGGAAFEPVTSGRVTVEGNAYTLEGLGLKVVSDGTTRWTTDPDAQEVVIESVQPSDIYTNPAYFISSYTQYLDSIHVNASGPNFLDVTLSLDKENKARFVLKEVEFLPSQGKSDFTFDGKSLPSGYLVTDLR